MPPSQLKRLKASLREQGITGPQQSKKQKKQNAQNGGNKEKRVHRTVALNGIREQFNPFEVKTSARGPKFEVTSNKTLTGRIGKSRPSVKRSQAEENRRETLLKEMQRRNKVGGIMDKRFGENDPTMAPEDKMLARFTEEAQRRHKSSNAFDLEDDDESGGLTHMGQSLSLDGPALKDDFEEEGLELSDAEDHPSDDERRLKRRRNSQGEETDGEDSEGEDVPERKKTKQEVMKEVIAKSKAYKYERQAVKDDDEDLREELDGELSSIHALLRGIERPKPKAPEVPAIAGMNPDRLALLTGTERVKFDKEYDMRLRQLGQDKRSKPTERSKTEEEKMIDEARRLQELEAKRLRRMQGEAEESDEEPEKANKDDDEEEEEEEEDFGLGAGIKTRVPHEDFGVEDEDDFIIDDDLVASGSEIADLDEDGGSESDAEPEVEEDDEFLAGLLTNEEAQRPEFLTGANAPIQDNGLPEANGVNGDLAYTYECPTSHDEFLEVTKKVNILDLPTAVQRIRALYHPKLKSENKAKSAKFAVALVDHISYLANSSERPPYSILETLIRHVHSMAKTYPVEVANAFRRHLEELHESRALSPSSGDLVLLTAIGTVFPTSDHFHQVVTPAILSMARYLGQKIPQTLGDFATGIYMGTLCTQYQRLSKRYVPEVVSFALKTLHILTPEKLAKFPGTAPFHEPQLDYKIMATVDFEPSKLTFYDTAEHELPSEPKQMLLKLALLQGSLGLVDAASDVWVGKSAFIEVFQPALDIMKNLLNKNNRGVLPPSRIPTITKTAQKLERVLKHAHLARRPLELHHHKPLAIKTSIPKFEDSFNPDKHYDPDRERAEASKLRAEHKREKKGAMRELRKDANFIARESLREKKERDAAYEKKYKRLVAEIQGEEGRESKAYEREKEWRKKGKK